SWFRRCSTCPEAEAVIAGFQDVAVMSEAVEQSGGHLGVAEHAGPFAEAEVGGNDDAGLLVELAEQMEQQRPASRAERQIAQLVEDDEVETQQTLGKLSRFV